VSVLRSTQARDWAQLAERGSLGALRLAAWIHRVLGRRVMHGALWIASAYFYLTNRVAREGSRQYLERLWSSPEGRRALGDRPGRFTILRHIDSFAINIYDRMVVWGGALDAYEVEHDGSEKIFDLAEGGRGVLLLGAHLGSFELLWLLSREYRLAVNVVVYQQNAERINAFFRGLDTGGRVRAIGLDPGSVEAAFQIKACIDRGEFVVMLADRVGIGVGDRAAQTMFLGAPARFPLGPFQLAGVLGCPVWLALCVRTRIGRYRTVLRPLRESGRIGRADRDARARELLERYVRLVESFCFQFPLEWFNYYRFWETDS